MNPLARINLQDSSGHSTATLTSLISFATFVLIIATLYWGQAVLIPLALAILLTFLLSPVADALERIAFSLLGGIGWIVTLQFVSLANELPKYTGNIKQKRADVRGARKGGALEKVQKTVEEVKTEIQKNDEPQRPKISAVRSSCNLWNPPRFGPTDRPSGRWWSRWPAPAS